MLQLQKHLYEKHMIQGTIYAPEDGAIYHPNLNGENQKATIGRWYRSGSEFIGIYWGESVNISFRLPEKLYRLIKIGDVVSFQIKGNSKDQYQATIFQIDFYPEMLGAVSDDFKQKDATLKIFTVHANVKKGVMLLPGQDIEVYLKKE